MHCDVKPENILLSHYGRAEVKLIDFGSSCFLTDRLTTYTQSRCDPLLPLPCLCSSLGLCYRGAVGVDFSYLSSLCVPASMSCSPCLVLDAFVFSLSYRD